MKSLVTTLLAAGMFAGASTGIAFAFGAIAVDDSYGEEPSGAGYGFATQYSSKNEASAGAVEACQSEGNSNCKVVLTFEKCGAYAASRNNYGTGTGATMAAAEKAALTDCGEGTCVAIISDCE
jgi:hypothetical protein